MRYCLSPLRFADGNVVSCGTCPVCRLNALRSRSSRIQAFDSALRKEGYQCLFITLTYSNDNAPLYEYNDDDGYSYSTRPGVPPILGRPLDYGLSLVSNARTAQADGDRCTHLYYKDVQDYYKRLRISLRRKIKYTDNLYYYTCGEYGSFTHRAHYHIALFYKALPQREFDELRRLSADCWKFGRSDVRPSYTQGVANYLSSYIASHGVVSALPREALRVCRPKVWHSNLPLSLYVGDIKSFVHRTLIQGVFTQIVKDPRTLQLSEQAIPSYLLRRALPLPRGFGLANDVRPLSVIRYAYDYARERGLGDKLLKFNEIPFPIRVLDKHRDYTLSIRLHADNLRDRFEYSRSGFIGWTYQDARSSYSAYVSCIALGISPMEYYDLLQLLATKIFSFRLKRYYADFEGLESVAYELSCLNSCNDLEVSEECATFVVRSNNEASLLLQDSVKTKKLNDYKRKFC